MNLTKDEQALDNMILKIKTGSYLYGTFIKGKSDCDYSGVMIAPEKSLLGFNRIDEINLSKQIKDKKGKNTNKSVDFKLYEFRRFCKLAMENNPNIIEQLFVDKKNIMFINSWGKSLLSIKHLFPYKGLKQKFIGYAISQKKKMIIKADHYVDIKKGYDFLKSEKDKNVLGEYKNKNLSFFKFKNEQGVILIGDISIPVGCFVKKARKIVKQRLDKVRNRRYLMDISNYDTKYAMHLIRLLYEGIELLKTGELKFPLKCKDLLLDIRKGKYKLNEIIEISEDLEDQTIRIHEVTNLPSKPNFNKINNFVIKTYKNFFGYV